MRFVIAAIAALLLIQPASAGWRWTEWGATIADVQAGYAGDPLGEGGAAVTPDAIASKRFVIVPAEGLNVSVRLSVSEGKLSGVTEEPVNDADCPAFISYLEATFGQTGLAGTRTKWADDVAGNSLSVTADEPGKCSIRYSRKSR